jgi:integron integrase
VNHYGDFISQLATRQHVSAGTQNQAFAALLFLYREILGVEVGDLGRTVRARRGERLPTVLSPDEVRRLLAQMSGTSRLMAEVIFGGGLRVMECCRLRVQDVDFDNELLRVRGKGDKDRTTLLPQSVREGLRAHLARVRTLYDQDRAASVAGVHLPDALDRKYPNAGVEWAWYWVFPSKTLALDPRTNVVRRHHVSDVAIQRAVKDAVRKADIAKHASVHTLRHSFATHLLLQNVDIRQVQELLGHAHVETTMIYTHVLKELRHAPRSPLDTLQPRSP